MQHRHKLSTSRTPWSHPRPARIWVPRRLVPHAAAESQCFCEKFLWRDNGEKKRSPKKLDLSTKNPQNYKSSKSRIFEGIVFFLVCGGVSATSFTIDISPTSFVSSPTNLPQKYLTLPLGVLWNTSFPASPGVIFSPGIIFFSPHASKLPCFACFAPQAPNHGGPFAAGWQKPSFTARCARHRVES